MNATIVDGKKGLVRLENGLICTAEEARAMQGTDSGRLAAFRANKVGGAKSGLSARGESFAAAPAPKINVAAERGAGRDAERLRWATVFASPASKGQERMAVQLLAHKDNFAASTIISGLSALAAQQKSSAAQISQSWADIHAEIAERRGRA